MKLFLIGVVVLATFQSAICYDSKMKYLQLMRQRDQTETVLDQIDQVCPGKRNDFEEAFMKLRDCADGIDENSETMCSAFKNNFMRCSKHIVSVLDECAPEESKGIALVVFQGINNALNYVCKTDGEHIFELANNCILKYDDRSRMCQRRVRSKLIQYKRKAPTKTELCEVMTSFKPCFFNHLQESCGNRITRESFLGMFDALSSACSASNLDAEELDLTPTPLIKYSTINNY